MTEVFTPFDYQVTGIKHLTDNRHAALFATMGTGKTVMTLTAISELILDGAARGALICAPIRTLTSAWPVQVERWRHLNWLRVANMRAPEGVQAWEDGSADIYLTGSEVLPTITKYVKCRVCKGNDEGCDNCNRGRAELVIPGFVDKFIRKRKQIPVDIFVIDEISLARNPSSKRFNAIRPYLHDRETPGGKVFTSPFRRVWGLTGTPAPGGYLNLFAQVRLLDGGKRLGTAFTKYRDTYFDGDYLGFKYNLKPGAKEIIDEKISDIALVMLGSDYLTLPPCTYEDVEVEMPASAMKAYRVLEKEMLVELAKVLSGFKDDEEVVARSASALMGKLCQFAGGQSYDEQKNTHEIHGAKIDALKKIRKAHPKEPLLVMVAYVHEMARVLREFPEAIEFDEKKIPEWSEGKIPMFVGNPASMAHGVDGLQHRGRIIVWLTLTWNPEYYEQANARLIRLGQEHETRVIHVMAADTVDWAIFESLKNKALTQDGLMKAVKALQEMRALKTA